MFVVVGTDNLFAEEHLRSQIWLSYFHLGFGAFAPKSKQVSRGQVFPFCWYLRFWFWGDKCPLRQGLLKCWVFLFYGLCIFLLYSCFSLSGSTGPTGLLEILWLLVLHLFSSVCKVIITWFRFQSTISKSQNKLISHWLFFEKCPETGNKRSVLEKGKEIAECMMERVRRLLS